MPIRIYDIAQKLGVQSNVVLDRAKDLGISAAKVPSSSLDKITGEYLESMVAQWLKTQRPSVSKEKESKSGAAPFDQKQQTSFGWRPIQDLPVDWSGLVNPSVQEQVKAWSEQAEQMKKKESYNMFLVRLRREWSIETGILERLYSITDGATKTLIEQGFDAALLSHEDTDKPAGEVISIIKDHENAIEGLYQFVSGTRTLGTSYIKELHTVLTAHQETYEAVDTLGREVNPPLIRGEWKGQPNSLGAKSGIEFCPPIHVASEMEQLVRLHGSHQANRVPPDLEAAWLHHRFTQIHPFIDGNGRVARCLATLVFLKAHWFPLVITRTDREPYIGALRAADAGDLKPLVDLFGSLQSKAIRQAFSLSEETIKGTVALRGVLDAAKAKFRQLREEQDALQKQLVRTADTLHAETFRRLEEVAIEVTATIKDEGVSFASRASRAARDDKKAEYHKIQIVKCAQAQHYYANREAYQAWALLTICTKIQTEILFSFHGIGKSTGLLACAAMAYNRTQTTRGESYIEDVSPLSNEPFQFAYSENPTEVSRRFRHWLEEQILAGLDFWQRNLGI